jgi:hypothetical protein
MISSSTLLHDGPHQHPHFLLSYLNTPYQPPAQVLHPCSTMPLLQNCHCLQGAATILDTTLGSSHCHYCVCVCVCVCFKATLSWISNALDDPSSIFSIFYLCFILPLLANRYESITSWFHGLTETSVKPPFSL